MIANLLSAFAIFGLTATHGLGSIISPLGAQEKVISVHSFSLNNRYDVPSVSKVFADNILLNMAYMDGKVTGKNQINWNDIRKPFEYTLKLEPGQTFAFHDQIEDKYKGKVAKTTNAHFNSYEGFESDGYLVGDGVCHLASLVNWTAKDAQLDVEAPTNHDFAKINEVPKEYGVAIFNDPVSLNGGAMENLYITNNQNKPIDFKFTYDGSNLKVSVVKEA